MNITSIRRYLTGAGLLGLAFLCITVPAMADALTGFTISNLCEPAGCLTSAIGPTGTFDFDGYTFNIVTPQATKIVYGNNGASQYLTFANGGGLFYLQQSNQTLLTGAFLPGASETINVTNPSFKGNFSITYVNPALLDWYGIPNCFTSGTGSLNVSSFYVPSMTGDYDGGVILTTSLVATPEPRTFILAATGLFGIAFVMGLKK